MDFLEDLKISLLNFTFAMIYIIHRMLLLLKNHLNLPKDNISKCFFVKNFFFLLIFFITYLMRNPRPEEENMTKKGTKLHCN